MHTGALFWSAEHFRICGLEPGSVQPSREMFFALVHPDDRACVSRSFDQAVRERVEYKCCYRIVRSDQSIRDVEAVGRPVLNESGEPIQFVGTVVDVTEQMRTAAALRAVQADLARMSRVAMLGELSASLAHELNQPLAAIVANCDASLRWQRRSPPNLKQSALAAERIRRDALRASAVVESIRAFLQKAEPERTPVDLAKAVHEVLEWLTCDLQRHEIEIQVLIPTSFPSILGTRVELQQVILNLCANAIESLAHVPVGQRRKLSIECTRDHLNDVDVGSIVVQDSGPGFDDDDRDRLFDAFFTTKSEGLGMGLAISRSIVRRHGGELRGRNTSEGPRFEFYIPLPCTTAERAEVGHADY
jgi:PAS domain S-box-containing protein